MPLKEHKIKIKYLGRGKILPRERLDLVLNNEVYLVLKILN